MLTLSKLVLREIQKSKTTILTSSSIFSLLVGKPVKLFLGIEVLSLFMEVKEVSWHFDLPEQIFCRTKLQTLWDLQLSVTMLEK